MAAHEMESLASSVTRTVAWAREHSDELRRDDAARQLWAAVYPRLSDGLPGLLGAATGRAEAQVLRLSAVYAVLDQSVTIRIEHLQAALSLWDYCFASARFIFGDATGDATTDRIRGSLKMAGSAGLSRTAIRDLFKRHVSGERIGRALQQLEQLGMAFRRDVLTEGRSIEVWTATEATEASER